MKRKKNIYDLFNSFTKIKDICKYYNVNLNTYNLKYIHKIADEIGFDLKIYKQKRRKYKFPKYCLFCGKEIIGGDVRKKFCNSSCAAKYNNKRREGPSDEVKIKISESLKKVYSDEEKRKLLFHDNTKVSKHLKDKLIQLKMIDNKCSCCGNDGTWMGKPLKLQLHHIDGNTSNNSLENLTLLCPNCHSQTDNYCSLNRKHKLAEKNYCKKCGTEISKRNLSGLCKKCYQENEASKSKIPTKEVLNKDYLELKSYSSIAKKYNISIKTLKKWLLKYDII